MRYCASVASAVRCSAGLNTMWPTSMTRISGRTDIRVMMPQARPASSMTA
jgi:hypothetical protein